MKNGICITAKNKAGGLMENSRWLNDPEFNSLLRQPWQFDIDLQIRFLSTASMMAQRIM